jgi:DNA-binding response OmpR family regulator
MDGWEATRQIRDWCPVSANRRIPIIAISASATEADRRDAKAAGMDDFLVKPYTLADLSGVLARWLPRQTPPTPADPALDAATATLSKSPELTNSGPQSCGTCDPA